MLLLRQGWSVLQASTRLPTVTPYYGRWKVPSIIAADMVTDGIFVLHAVRYLCVRTW